MANQPAQIHYEIVPADPGGHVFDVSCVIANPDTHGQRFSLPAWLPGSYLIRDFAGSLMGLEASANDLPVGVQKQDKSVWQCEPCNGPLRLHYKILANDLTVRGAHLDVTHGFFDGARVFVRIHGHEDVRCTVSLDRNPNERFADWHLATSMHRVDAEPHGFGLYEAAEYAELIDHPFEMGTFHTQYFEAHGVPHQLVVTGKHHGDLTRVARDLKSICEKQMEFFGMPSPVDRYVFLLTVLGNGYGGLEHRWSSSLMAKRSSLPKFGSEKVSKGYRGFLGLASHEYFHLWNVKRIRPAPVAESDLSREAYTRQLWIFEGITSYYDDMFLLRSGVIETPSYLQLISDTATTVWSGSGRFTQCLADASFDAWIKFYKRDDSAPNTQVSYYTKGALVALGLDLTIRAGSNNRKSLDDVMRVVWEQHGKTDVPLPDGRFEEIAAEVSGVSLQDYFDRVIRDVEDPPLADLLDQVGVEFLTLPLADGATRAAKNEQADVTPALHVGTRNVNGRLCLSTIYTHGPAHRAGLASGDELVAIEGIRVTAANYASLLAQYRPGEVITVEAFRRDELRHFSVELDPPPRTAVRIKLDDMAGDAAIEARQLWLNGTTL